VLRFLKLYDEIMKCVDEEVIYCINKEIKSKYYSSNSI